MFVHRLLHANTEHTKVIFSLPHVNDTVSQATLNQVVSFVCQGLESGMMWHSYTDTIVKNNIIDFVKFHGWQSGHQMIVCYCQSTQDGKIAWVGVDVPVPLEVTHFYFYVFQNSGRFACSYPSNVKPTWAA